MIGKIIKGRSFKGCISYVLDKENAKLLHSEGVLATDTKSVINGFYMQSLMNPKLSKCVGHIPLSYSKEDAPRLTDDFMVQLAKEYMKAMKIENTQYIIVRHNDTQHPHCHIVYNRVDNDGKTISDKNDHYRNELVTKELKRSYNLYFGESKENVNRNKLNEPDSTKMYIHDAVKSALKHSKDWKQFITRLSEKDVELKFKRKGQTDEVQGISFVKGDYSFKGSEVDRSFSFSRLNEKLRENQQPVSEQQTFQTQKQEWNPHQESAGGILVELASGLGGLFDFKQHPEEEYNPFKYRKKKKRKGLSR